MGDHKVEESHPEVASLNAENSAVPGEFTHAPLH
jgi:hypothetical protein